jgi:hypothetical protein
MGGMKTYLPVLGFRNKSVPERMQICARTISALGRMPEEQRSYADVPALEARLAKATGTLEHIAALEKEMRLALSERNREMAELCREVTIAVGGVRRSNVNTAALGLRPKRYAVRPVRPAQPERFRAVRVIKGGLVRLACTRSSRQGFFRVEMTLTPDQPKTWKPFDVFMNARWDVSGLQPGTCYWFRVAESNGAGTGPWSQPLQVTAL